jgi:septal ring factor EnvC (AmiA/AmiB activator)
MGLLWGDVKIDVGPGARLSALVIFLVSGAIFGCVGWIAHSNIAQSQIVSAEAASKVYQAQSIAAVADLTRAQNDLRAITSESQKKSETLAVLNAMVNEKNAQLEKSDKDIVELKLKNSELVARMKVLENPPKRLASSAPKDPVLDEIPRLRSDKTSLYISSGEATLVGSKRYSLVAVMPDWMKEEQRAYKCFLVINDLTTREQTTVRFANLGSPGSIPVGERTLEFVLVNVDIGACIFQHRGG